MGSRPMIKQKEYILKHWLYIVGNDREKELLCLVDEVQKIMLERIRIFKDLTPEQLNVLAMEIK